MNFAVIISLHPGPIVDEISKRGTIIPLIRERIAD